MILVILNLFFLIAFLAFAYLNFNDIDWYLWVPIYLSAAVCCGLAAFGHVFYTIYLLLITCYLFYALLLFFQKDGVRDWITKYNKPSLVESMQATKPYIEKTREFFGLLIIAGALLIDYFTL
ncbi:transmembrane 220 family protein [Mucilaginibacter sp. FT3.2]|uniref:transmembrane 220 family protein n=1 Tax=Mucilaginibacter sp. FT3.2 TaxID=2723090 RepID=UPI001611FCD0|nr:transmembrane 220 family protein [Mucilaginibacter sp. FT3.2]MBB6232903.1 hypothetical protein [Mucilaginibacter sp. FT3.2]